MPAPVFPPDRPATRMEPPAHLARSPRAAIRHRATGFPALVDALSDRWGLTPERVVVPGGRASMVILVRTADGTPGALKLHGRPERAGPEHAALRAWDGRGAVRSWRCDPRAGALLLERLRPAVSLRSLPEAKAVLETVSVGRRLWVEPEPGHPFPDVTARSAAGARFLRWMVSSDAEGAGEADPFGDGPGNGRFPAPGPPGADPIACLPDPAALRPMIREALETRAELLATAPAERLLLHGRLCQGTVLASGTDRAPWLAVGPEPVVGERAWEVARVARDRPEDLMATSAGPVRIRRALARLAETVEVDRERLRGWTVFRAVESGVLRLTTGDRIGGETLLEFAARL
ncbi:aminoglycoside phosphotransferase family protein [Streptomyces sp. ST2-7A]|uniref:aminoglycoside phosphotransferase family protein n=1 Tax=Streptomyces sp. ST2-7A TaxID=2907214 RepID=UPI001F3F397E|nr:aminoglycoside phosphotransferase family protein [Streptomyces sp. ST2-7A]MCE7080014.1 aminoglycoside phosphotransferase family protein [Streptomyces sp. ST2-7A]